MSEETAELSREELLQRYTKKPPRAATSKRRSPFKFLDSYDVDDADIFFGRDSEIEELLGNFHSYGHVLIYGESGSGKSSLVQCGLRARIPEADALFIGLRVHAAGLSTVCNQICEAAGSALGEAIEVSAESNLVDTLREVRDVASRPIVLFFDQFEELSIFHDRETRHRFAEELAAIRTAKLNVKVIIGVRQDYLAQLTELEETVEGVFDNRFWLRRMLRENAAQAVVKACGTCDVAINGDLAESILHRLDPGSQGVELPYLQVVMDRLFRQAVDSNPDQPVIAPADVEKLGDIAHILGTFLVEEVAKLPSPDTGRQILKAFVTREATRRSLDRTAVAQESAGFGEAIAPDVLDTHLNQLASVRILREIADSGTFELRHDALAATVAGWISELEKELIEVRDNLVNRFKEYEARGHETKALLDGSFLNYLGMYEQRLKPLLTDKLQAYVHKSRSTLLRQRRKKQLLIGGAALATVLVVVVALLAYAIEQGRVAEEQIELRKEAVQAKKEAVEATKEAEEEKQRALDANAKADALLVEALIDKGDDAVNAGNYAQAVSYFHGASKLKPAEGSAQNSTERVLIGAWIDVLGRPLLHKGSVFSVAFGPDGEILTGCEDGTAQLWDAGGMPQGKPLQHTSGVYLVSFSPNGKTALTVCDDDVVRVWDIASGTLHKELVHEQEWNIHTAAFNGQFALTVGDRDQPETRDVPKLWDVATAKFRELDLRDLRKGEKKGEERVGSAAFSSDGTQLLTGGDSVGLWDVGDGALELKMVEPKGGIDWIVAVGWQKDRVMGMDASGWVYAWDANTGKLQGKSWLAHDDSVSDAAFSSDGKTILTGSWDSTARLWQVVWQRRQRRQGKDAGNPAEDVVTVSARQLRKVRHTESVGSVAFSPDGQSVLTGSDDGTARLWDASVRDQAREEKTNPAGKKRHLAFSPDGTTALSRARRGDPHIVRLWDVDAGAESRPRDLAHPEGSKVRSTVFSPDSKTVLTLTRGDDFVRLWNVGAGDDDEPRKLKDPPDKVVRSAVFSPDGTTVVTTTKDDGTMRLWNVTTGMVRKTLQHEQRINAFAFSPDGKTVTTASDDATVRMWDLVTGAPGRKLEHEEESAVINVAYSPDGQTVLTTVRGKKFVRLWNLVSNEYHDLDLGQPVIRAGFSPDGTSVFALAGDGESIRLWNTEKRKVRGNLRHRDRVNEIAFSNDGRTLVTTVSDGNAAWLWDVKTAALRGELRHAVQSQGKKKQKAKVQAVVISEDGTTVLTGCQNYTARLWDAKTGVLLREFEHDAPVEAVAFAPDGKAVLTESADGVAKLWDTPEPIAGEAESLQRAVEIRTGWHFDDSGIMRRLSRDEWLRRKQQSAA